MGQINKATEHSKFLEKWLLAEAEKRNNSLGNELEYHAVCDKERHHYQLLKMGWIGNRFVFFTPVSF